MALDELVAAACKLDQTAHKKLLSLFGSAAAGKENGNPKEIKAAALQCLKAAQSHLASRNSAPDWVMQNASLGQASLAALEAQAVGAARWQLLPLRYNFVKRLVAAGGHEAAWQEAHVLHVQLDSCDPPQTAEAANIAVGAVLMLLLCCVEAPGLASTKLTASLRAVLGLNQWLRAGAASDAEKHRDAVFKYLYRAAACLLEADSSGLLAEVVAAMVTIASSETHLHRALQVSPSGSSSSSRDARGWVDSTTSALTVAMASAAVLQHACRTKAQLDPWELQGHASVVAAAYQASNLLRKSVAGREPVALVQQLNSEAAVAAVADQFQALGQLVAAAHAVTVAGALKGTLLTAQLATMAKQGHSAVVGLGLAAKLRAACIGSLDGPILSAGAVKVVLGWDFGIFCASGGHLPSSGVLSKQELSWLISALYNLGVDLHGSGNFRAAVPPLLATVSASMCSLAGSLQQCLPPEAVSQHAQDVVKRCIALSDAQARSGDPAAAASSLAHAVVAMVRLGLDPAAWEELLRCLAKQVLDAQLAAKEAVAEAPPAPAPKSKGARVGKGGTNKAKASTAASSRSQSSNGRAEAGMSEVAAPLRCSGILCSFREEVPDTTRAAVAELELSAWATLATSTPAATAECAHLGSFLLNTAFPVHDCPVEHARIMLAAYQACIPLDELSGMELLERAVSLLGHPGQGGLEASIVGARAHSLLALGTAQQLAEQNVQKQQQHAMAAMSAAAAADSSVDRDSFPHITDWAAWAALTAEQLTSLMQLGRLLELSGMPEEALHAFKEGLRLAVSIGAALLAAAFRVHLADIYSKQGNVELARQALRPVGSLIETAGSKPSPTALCCLLGAEAEVAEARMSLSSLDSPAAWEHCQAAVDLCLRAGTDGQADLEACEELACYLASTHAASLLVGAECRARLGDSQAVAQLAQQACEVLGPHAPSRSNGTQQQQRAMALLALALQPALAAPKQQGPILVWGLQPAPISDASQDSARPSRAKAAAAKKVAGRAGRVKPLAMEPAADSNLGSRGSRMQQLWQAYWLTKEIPHLHRVVGPHLAKECAQAGYLHLAALLLHLSLGATLRQQYRLVLHTKLQQQQHQQHKAGTNGEPDIACSGASLGIGSSQARSTDDCSTQQTLQVALEQLVDPLDHRQVGQLAGLPAALPAEQQQQQPARARRRPQAERQEQLDAAGQELSQAALLLQLEQQAAVGLQQWLMALPEGTVVCSASAHAAGCQQIGSGGGLHRLVDILLRLLEESGQSMRELATDTREQQREWWRTRLALDSQLAALLRTLGEDWLGCWRGLMFGAAADGEQHLQASESWLHRVQHYLEQAGLPPLSEQQCSVALAAIGSVLQSSGSSMGQKGPQEAIAQICSCLGLSLTAEQIAAAEDVPSSGTSAAGFMGEQPPEAASPQKHGSRATNTSRSVAPKPSLAPVGRTHRKDMYGSTSSSREPTEEPAKGRRTRGGKAVSFQLGESPVDEARTSEEPHAHSQIAVSSRAGKAAVSLLAVSGSACSPAWQGSPPREEPGGLCEVFDAMSLQPQRPADEPAAATTARASKTRSSSLADPESDLSAGAQPLASAENGRASSTVLESSPGPVLLVLDGELQALPWESVPGLQQQRIYRIPSLPCAAASTKRSQRSVNLGSTFYSLNPSGDLSSTQSTFQDWFATLRWEGKAGEPPTATELAKGLQSHQLFVYLGHGGGDQYIPAGKLRSLDSCSAALLMGCSSGRLRLRRHYEPTGPVLAYLLAGCPAAIANLWDVTDKDIDRFSQALLSTWVGEEDRSGAGNNGDSSNGLGVATPTKVDISAAVAASRGACKLPNLIGTAPVCYGVPTAVEPGNSVCQ
ncbi:hypothetical protein N2152v2_005227 [Parachlorella kessleri]